MADGDHQIGLDAKCHYNTATNASPTWVAIPRIGDVTIDATPQDVELATRESQFLLWGQGQIDLTVNITGYLHIKGADTVFTALQAASRQLGNTPVPIQFALMDQAIATSGAKGWKAFLNLAFSQRQELNGGLMSDITGKPARHYESSAIVVPSWFVVS